MRTAQRQLQQCINKITHWANTNGLKISKSKTGTSFGEQNGSSSRSSWSATAFSPSSGCDMSWGLVLFPYSELVRTMGNPTVWLKQSIVWPFDPYRQCDCSPVLWMSTVKALDLLHLLPNRTIRAIQSKILFYQHRTDSASDFITNDPQTTPIETNRLNPLNSQNIS